MNDLVTTDASSHVLPGGSVRLQVSKLMWSVHCGQCCANRPGASATRRLLYAPDGEPVCWVLSDDELLAEALAERERQGQEATDVP